VLFHTDAVQAVGKVPFNVNDMKVDMASMTRTSCIRTQGSARSTSGAGIRACCCRRSSMAGGTARHAVGHPERHRHRRFRQAAELCMQEMASESQRLSKLRDRLNDRLHKGLDEIYINGSMEHRLPHNLNISFAVEAVALWASTTWPCRRSAYVSQLEPS
jgi:cysteine desulfurase